MHCYYKIFQESLFKMIYDMLWWRNWWGETIKCLDPNVEYNAVGILCEPLKQLLHQYPFCLVYSNTSLYFFFQFVDSSGLWTVTDPQKKLLKTWGTMNTHLRSSYHNFLSANDLILAMSPSTAEVERSFSQLKLIKTDHRNSMTGNMSERFPCVKLLTPGVSSYDLTGRSISWLTDVAIYKNIFIYMNHI